MFLNDDCRGLYTEDDIICMTSYSPGSSVNFKTVNLTGSMPFSDGQVLLHQHLC